MRSPEQIATALLKVVFSVAPTAEVIGDVQADELALLIASTRAIGTCPTCGAEAWCNIDCRTCTLMHDMRDL